MVGTADARFVPVPAGQGAVNLEGFLKSVIKDGYEGFLDVEPHTVEDRLDEFYAEGLKLIAKHLS